MGGLEELEEWEDCRIGGVGGLEDYGKCFSTNRLFGAVARSPEGKEILR